MIRTSDFFLPPKSLNFRKLWGTLRHSSPLKYSLAGYKKELEGKIVLNLAMPYYELSMTGF